MRFFWMSTLVLLLSLTISSAEETKGMSITLLSEQSSISEGKTFTVGVSIKHEKGFHTYWRNPGSVGMATAVKWNLPDGFTAEPIQWSYPELTFMASHPCYGYERDVMLMVQIKAPEKVASKQVKLTADLSWMCCADDCFPGFEKLSITLPVSENTEIHKGNVVAFSDARKELPLKNCPWDVVLLSQQDQPIIQFRFTLRSGQEETTAPEYLFSDDGQISSNKKQQFIKQADGSYLLTIDRSEYSPKLNKEFAGVLKIGKNHYSFLTTYKK